MELLGYIDRFGVEAVTGRRVLGAGEMRRMIAAENVYQGYRERQHCEGGWAKWAADNPTKQRLLERARVAAEEMTGGEDGGSPDTNQSN